MTITTGLFTPNTDAAEKLLALSNAAQNPTVNTLTVVSGTAQQDTTGLPSDVYVGITGGASGTVAVAIGPTSTPANTIITAEAETTNIPVYFRLPAGWYFTVTVGGSATITASGSHQVIGG